MKNKVSLILVFAITFTGCATTSTKLGYKKDSVEFREFKELSDDEALKMVAELYNVTPDNEKDGIAKNITLTEYMADLKKRKSPYIDASGMYELSYTEVDLRKWSDQEIVEFYKYLTQKVRGYERVNEVSLSERAKAIRVIHITARNAVYAEGKRRDIVRQLMEVVGTVLVTALNAALYMI
jgi:hypothetical protein